MIDIHMYMYVQGALEKLCFFSTNFRNFATSPSAEMGCIWNTSSKKESLYSVHSHCVENFQRYLGEGSVAVEHRKYECVFGGVGVIS